MLYKMPKNILGNMRKMYIITIKRIDKSYGICYIECVGVFAPFLQKEAGDPFLCGLRLQRDATKKPPVRRRESKRNNP